MSARSYTLFFSLFAILLLQITRIDALVLTPPTPNARAPASPLDSELRARQDASTGTPVFPADPPSCPKCEASYGSIDSCASAAPIFENVSMIIFNPGAFIDVIKCACTDTFQAAYPQCVDCFIRTNQTAFLSADSDQLPDIISGIRSVCAIESTLLGNVSVANSEVPSGAANTAEASPTETGVLANSAVQHHFISMGSYVPLLIWIVGVASCFI